ncbi:VanW family protein [Nocardioides sp. CPCC 206347]|uniref:VanW family protein n=1 Tax=unclassified Nocardioides TaxID=2615069 RepID=UPI00361971F0
MTNWEPTEGKSERAGGKVVAGVVAILVVLVGGAYAGAYALAGDKVPRGTSISGVDVGGLSRDAAVEKLTKVFDPRADASIDVSVESASGKSAEGNGAAVEPGDIGLRVDYAASVDAAGAGSSWSPGRQWDYFTGGTDVDAVVTVDDTLFDAKLDDLSKGLGTPPKDGQVNFTPDGVETVEPQSGKAVDRDAARTAIIDAYLAGEKSVSLQVADAEPEIDAADVAEAAESFANPAMANAVTLVFGENDIKLEPRKFAAALSMKPENGELVPVVDQAVLTRLVEAATTTGKPVDATVKLVKGKPKVIPAKPGVAFDPADVATVFTGLLTAPQGSRSGEVKAEVTDAEFTTQDAKDLKIVEKVSQWVTYYPHADYRNVNIGRAAELIDGTVLKPGERFSLNGIVGERTAENGFTEGYVINNGILKKDLGGGVSQLATTTFNAMFYAGLKDIEHKPHSFYIDRYPAGREATVAWPTVDMSFENDSPYGVLVRAWVQPSSYSSQGVVTVQMWSTKVWDIKSKSSERYAYVAPATRTLTTPDCEVHTGSSGFQIDVTRIFRKHGESTVHHTEKFHTNYTPADTVVCKKPGPPPPEDPEPGD